MDTVCVGEEGYNPTYCTGVTLSLAWLFPSCGVAVGPGRAEGLTFPVVSGSPKTPRGKTCLIYNMSLPCLFNLPSGMDL